MLKAAEMWFYIRNLKASWTKYVSNKDILRKIETKWQLYLETVKISGTHNEESGPGEIDIHMIDRREVDQWETPSNLPNEIL